MNTITTKGLLLRMTAALLAIIAVLSVYPVHAAEMGKVFTRADTIAQIDKSEMPSPPTIEQHQKAVDRVMQLRALHPTEPDAIGNIRPRALNQPRLQAPAFGEWDDQGKE